MVRESLAHPRVVDFLTAIDFHGNLRFDCLCLSRTSAVRSEWEVTSFAAWQSDTQQPTYNARFFSGRGRTFTLGWDYRF